MPADPRPWVSLRDEALLEWRLCDLGLEIAGTALERRIERLHVELQRAGLRFRPYVWLSTDWFTPDGHTGFAVPFFLAHPRLAHLERRQMYAVEGGNADECMRLLRHETAHAIDNAYRIRRRKAWRERFGRASTPYRWSYVPDPNSPNFVINLDNWYAQSHPVEDFAETFAVWLRGGRWRQRYADQPVALRKLRYVDALMQEIADVEPPVRTRECPDSISTLRFTLREYYERKHSLFSEDELAVYDRDLERLFPVADGRKRASTILREHRKELRERVAHWTGQHAIVVDEVLKGMIVRARELRLRARRPDADVLRDAAILLTVHTMRHVRRRHREYFR